MLRVSSAAFDKEITSLIEAARQDLLLSGVAPFKANDDTDPLVRKAIMTYCKAEFGFDNKEAYRFRRSYEDLRNHLTLAGEYNAIP